MLRLTRITSGLLLLAVFACATGQSGDGELTSLFGVKAESLALDNVLVYPAHAEPAISRQDAEETARGESHREEPILDSALVKLRLPDLGYEGLVWAVAFDVTGTEASWPGGSLLPEDATYVYTLSVTFIDARTGAFITSVSESAPGKPGADHPPPYEP